MESRQPTRRFSPIFVIVLMLGLCGLVAVPAAAQEEPAAEEQAAAQTPAPASDPEPAAPQMAEAQKVFRSAATVIVDGKAEVNGVLTMTFEPNGGQAKQVRINVVAKANAKKIGKELANQFAFTVGSDYKVKGDGNKVVVKAKNKKVAPFWIGIDEQALTGVSVRVTK